MGGRGEGGEESAFKNEFWHLAMKLHLHPLLPPLPQPGCEAMVLRNGASRHPDFSPLTLQWKPGNVHLLCCGGPVSYTHLTLPTKLSV